MRPSPTVDLLDALAIPNAFVYGIHTGNKVAAAMAAGWLEQDDPHRPCDDESRSRQVVGDVEPRDRSEVIR